MLYIYSMETIAILVLVCACVAAIVIKNNKTLAESVPQPKEGATLWDEYERCKDYIKERLADVYPACTNSRTIEGSNRIFYRTLEDAKSKIFATVQISEKEEVIEMVEKYYAI
jgi:hypothetical protein